MKAFLYVLLAGILYSHLLNGQPVPDVPHLPDSSFTTHLQGLVGDSALKAHDFDFSKPLPKGYAEADLRILKRILEEAHTTLYRYATKAQIDSAFAHSLERAQGPMYYLDLVREAARIQHTIACGHTGWGHSTTYRAFRKEQVKLFPFQLRVLEGKYHLRYNYSFNRNIADYSELTHLNGIPIPDLVKQLRMFMYADGRSATGTTYDVDRFFSNAYSNFIGSPERFTLRLREKEGLLEKEISVKGLTKTQIDSIQRLYYPDVEQGLGIPLCFRYVDSLKTGIYTIKWFRKEYMAHFGQDFARFTDSVFSVLQEEGAKHLILDLRDNKGGWTAHGKYLLSYFVTEEIDVVKHVRTKKPRDFSFAPIINMLPGYLDTFDLNLLPNGEYNWINYPSLRVSPASQNNFTGKLYVLANGGSRSCVGMVASLLREHTSALFLGGETGNARCGSAGMVMAVELPYTGLQFYFSTARYTFAVKDTLNPEGVQPDIEQGPRLKEVLQGRDYELEQSLKMVSKSFNK